MSLDCEGKPEDWERCMQTNSTQPADGFKPNNSTTVLPYNEANLIFIWVPLLLVNLTGRNLNQLNLIKRNPS